MSVQSGESRTVPQVTRDLITRFHDILEDLPPPGTQYRAWMLPSALARRTHVLNEGGVIHAVGSVGYHGRPVWETDERAYAAIENYEPGGPVMPCGHAGLVNLGEDGYTCGDADCPARFDRETAKGALEG